jgi:hypothetical protein
VALAVFAALLLVGWLWYYRPWQAHYMGRPSSYWAERLAKMPKGLSWLFYQPSLTLPEKWLARGLAPFGIEGGLRPSALELYGQAEAVPVLIELLRNPEPRVRANAAMILRDLEPAPKEAIPALLEAWQQCKADYCGGFGEVKENGNAEDADAAWWVHEAVWQIDPAAAQRAGIPYE